MYVPACVNVNDAVADVAPTVSVLPLRSVSADVPVAAESLHEPVDSTTFASSWPLARSRPDPLLSVNVVAVPATTEVGLVENEVGTTAATVTVSLLPTRVYEPVRRIPSATW